jgi:hypothetical protein
MFRGLIALAAGIFLLAVVGVAIADEVKGKITKVDADKKTITVEDKDKKATVIDAGDAKVKLGKKDGAFGDLKVDQAVTVTFDKKGDKNVASEIKGGKAK